MKHGLATLLAATDVEEVFLAFEQVPTMTPLLYQVLNSILCAVVHHVSDRNVLERLAEGVVQNILVRETEMKLIMPPTLALLVPTGALCSERVLELLLQSHRFVIVHHCIEYYWTGTACSNE